MLMLLPKREKEETLAKMAIFCVPPTLWQRSTAHFKIPPRQKAGNAKNIIGSRKHISNKNQMNENIYISTCTD